MKTDFRVSRSWISDGSIFHMFKKDLNVRKKQGLYEGRIDLGHSVKAVSEFFKKYTPQLP